MDESALQRFRTRLTRLLEELLAEGDIRIDPNRTDPSAVGGDEDEQPLTEMNQVIASKRNRERTAKLALVRRALARLNDDPEMFGLCEECEEPMGKRLEAVPYAQLCLECQSNQDDKSGPRGGARKHLLDFK